MLAEQSGHHARLTPKSVLPNPVFTIVAIGAPAPPCSNVSRLTIYLLCMLLKLLVLQSREENLMEHSMMLHVLTTRPTCEV